MIWDTPPKVLSEFVPKLTEDNRLQYINITTDALGQPIEPIDGVRFFQIPPQAHSIGRLVVPFVHLTSAGVLDDRSPAIYGVTSRPSAYTNIASEKRSQQVHVLAEHSSLTHGIFRKSARLTSEAKAAKLIPTIYMRGYIHDRAAHLGALVEDIKSSHNLTPGQREHAAIEIVRAIDMFQNMPEFEGPRS